MSTPMRIARPFRLLAMMVALMTAAACASSRGDDREELAEAVPATPSAERIAQRLNVITPDDQLSIDVFAVEDLTGIYEVGPDGQFKFPLIGLVDAQGLTPLQLSEVLEGRLGERYLQNPDVRVSFSARPGRTITVEGAVNDPGIKDVPGPVSLLQAVALSGGPTLIADPKDVTVFRMTGNRRIATTYNLLDIREGRARDPLVIVDDMVVVETSKAKERFEQIVRVAPIFNILRFY